MVALVSGCAHGVYSHSLCNLLPAIRASLGGLPRNPRLSVIRRAYAMGCGIRFSRHGASLYTSSTRVRVDPAIRCNDAIFFDGDSDPTNLLHNQGGDTSFQNDLLLPLVQRELVHSKLDSTPQEILQGTEEWYSLRKDRLTASSFGNALGFWKERRVALWEEKIGLTEPFSGNSATRWGSSQEAAAIERYKKLTGNQVNHLAFKIYHDGDEYLSWLGASPDGLITYKNESESTGILEVKCPHNKGRPEHGIPWDSVPYYYIPQAQGLLEILDRDCMDFYVWTTNGSAVFRINRDHEYWGLMFRLMSEYWWGHVVPARRALSNGASKSDVQVFKPSESHPSTTTIMQKSRSVAKNCPLISKYSSEAPSC